MIKIRKEEEEYIVSLYEVRKLNVLFSDTIGSELRDLASEKDVKIFFDLSKISFIDSTGFNMLKEINSKAKENGSELILCNASEEITELLDLPDLKGIFTTCRKKLSEEKIMVTVE